MAAEDDAPPRSDVQQLCWLAIFGANLIVPLAMGWPLASHGGQVGMFVGLAGLFAVWQFALPRIEPLRAALVPGGIAVAASQLFLALHWVVVGFVLRGAWRRLAA